MAERGDSSDDEPTIAQDVVVTKYKMAGDMANSKSVLTLINTAMSKERIMMSYQIYY